MIQRISSILKDRIAAFSYVDKIGGLTRVARQQREGSEIVIPVAGDVDAAYACDPATIRDMVPDDRYGCIVYFEDRGTTRETSRTRGTFYSASIRLVCWVNTSKFGSDPNAADRILEQFTNDLNVGQPYNTDTLIGIKHQVNGIPQRGASIFSQYTYPEAARQYLLWPFDAFALDITVAYRIKPGCDEAPVPDDNACWTPPTTKKRMNPRDFTCDELTDPLTGLTAEQLGPDCLDCGGGGTCDPLTVTVNTSIEYATENNPCGATVNVEVVNEQDVAVGAKVGTKIVVPSAIPCAPTTVNGTESDTPTITVLQDGIPVGTLNPATGVHTVPPCPPPTPCDPFTVTVNDVIEFEVVDDPCGGSANVPVVNEADQEVGTLVAGKIVVPTAKSLCALVTEATSEEVGICVISSGKRQGVLAELIPTVDDADVLTQIIGPLTPSQDAVVAVTVQLRDSAAGDIGSPDVYAPGTTTTKTAPDGTVTVLDHLGDTLGSTTVKSNGTAQILVTDWVGEYPVLTENIPTYNDEGTGISGWTETAGSLSQPSASVVRFTQTTAGAAATCARAITMPVTNKDWVLYTKARAANGAGGKVIQIAGGGLERTNIGFHINYVTGSAAPGVLSIRHTTAAGTNTNAVALSTINATDYIDLALAYNSKFGSLSLFSRQTNGTWKFECHIAATFHGGNLQIVVNQSGTPAWLDFDWLTLVSPNIQSIGDSLTKGATLFSPVIAESLINGDSTWQRWAALYPAIRNNLTINKGVGGNTIGMVEARIQADVLDNFPALVLLGACSNDYGAGTTQANKTTNTQDCIDLCATAGVPVVLFNGTYCSQAWASNPAGGAYYKEWWTDYMPTLTGLEGTIDIMGGLKDPAGYADALLTQSDNVHPNVVGYGRMGQWIAALPYA